MEKVILFVMVAASVFVLAWWAMVMLSAFSGDKRRLAQRLSNDQKGKGGSPNLTNLSVILR